MFGGIRKFTTLRGTQRYSICEDTEIFESEMERKDGGESEGNDDPMKNLIGEKPLFDMYIRRKLDVRFV